VEHRQWLERRRWQLVRRRRLERRLVMKQQEFLDKLDQPRLLAAVRDAEALTSGEIRIHVQAKTYGIDIKTVAERTFERLGMTKTALRNGVLLFIATEEQAFYICGDKGIDEKVPAGFWDDVAAKLTEQFKSGQFTDGIVEAIGAVGEHLARFFPRASDDVNELSDDINVED
jgi:uncharacterized membrane protein